jgi:pyruvate-formate lyase-activating enzyme/glutaredoxin
MAGSICPGVPRPGNRERRMDITLFTATGCTRCKIAKRFMDERGVAYAEKDIKGDGKEDFRRFYATHRKAIHRGEAGVQFPIFSHGTEIRQGLGGVLAYVQAKTGLDGFIGYGERTGGWVDGLDVSGGDPSQTDSLIAVLRFLKRNGLKLELGTHGKNAIVLEQLLEQGLGNRVVMDVKGPLSLYARILGAPVDAAEIRKTLILVTRFPEYRFETTVAPFVPEQGESPEIRYITPDEIGKTAELIKDVTGDKRHPYVLRLFRPEHSLDERFKSIKALTQKDLFPYRTAARRHQVYAELEKS